MNLDKAIATLETHGLHQVLISDVVSINYLLDTQFELGERVAVLFLWPHRKPCLFLNKLFTFESEDVDTRAYLDSDDLPELIAGKLEPADVGVDHLFPAYLLMALQALRPTLKFFDGSWVVYRLRAIKSSAEIATMREASRRNDLVMERVQSALHEGLHEDELATLIIKWHEEIAQGISFEPIVSINENIADPHAHPTHRALQKGDAILIDMGGRYNGYCSDMTRTFFLGQSREEEIYQVVLAANLAGIAAVAPGVCFCDVDRAARHVIEQAGYGEYFTHRLGHGIGQSVHEPYDVSASNPAQLEVGMIFSIEPGIYIPGRHGVRIEDLVVVTADGCEVLNHFPKQLTIV